ncbi:transcription factor bHLH113 isoform X2 [Solanum dulcamara]|uniref:transcription factor bHLH113 isoform X2 n=1 Tax=Solanum dulcamara TaxID=45834 RepID=UPI0024850562|nr:transcription factor bHLH113 isoform X2 [Solanum dulcamara]
MAGEEESTLDGGTYSELLFADDDDGGLAGCFSFTTSSSPKMLCFGNDTPILENCSVQTPEAKTQKSGLTCSGDSQSACSSSNISKPNKKRNGVGKESVEKTKAGNQRNCKRTKLVENSNVKKEKLGERITALQQLVSPFGKTDTASVLHEAMGYIRFLHDQVHVLCSPYLQRQSQSQSQSPSLREGGESGETEASRNEVLLRSKGLCLVPIELTLHVVATTVNGADFWSPAAMMDNNNITQ